MKNPNLDDIKRYLKSELRLIQTKGYQVEDIFNCVNAYLNRQDAYKRKIEAFSLQIQVAPAINDYVHSVRFRTKDPYHLADKLARKCLDKEKSRIIKADKLFDPNEGITDLGGVRILHLRKEEWIPIHDYLVNPASMRGFSLIQKKAIIKIEKIKEYESRFDKDKGEIEDRKETGYTSLHYTFRSYDDANGELFFECQVRTLFEEGWGEIDHQMNYPYKANAIIGGYLSALNSSTHTANEIASKLETLLHIPLFVNWDTELKLERSADKVYCITPDLRWAANNLDKFGDHVRSSGGNFFYYILDNTKIAIDNLTKVKDFLKKNNLTDRVTLIQLPADKYRIPVIADLLLLLNAINPISREPCDISVVGAPAQNKQISQEEHLDMLITEETAINRMRTFFQGLPV